MSTDEILTKLLRAGDAGSAEQKQLQEVVSTLRKRLDEDLAEEPTYPAVVFSVEILGTLARIEQWRAPLARSGALDYALSVLHAVGNDSRHTLRRYCYRLITNVCADEDEGRQALSSRWSEFLALFQKDLRSALNDEQCWPTADAATAAMANFLRDNESITEQVLQSSLGAFFAEYLGHTKEIRLRSSEKVHIPFSFWDVVLEYCERLSFEDTADDLPSFASAIFDGFDIQGSFPDGDPDEWVTYVFARLFGNEDVRRAFASSEAKFTQLLRVFYSLQDQYVGEDLEKTEPTWASPTMPVPQMGIVNGPHIDSRAVKEMYAIITNVAAEADFPAQYQGLGGPIPLQLVEWVAYSQGQHNKNEHMLQVALLVIGNLSSVQAYSRMLQETHLAERLYNVVNHAEQDETRYLALSLLKHCFLNQPEHVRESAAEQVMSGLAQGLNSTQWGAAIASLALARTIVTPTNYTKFLEPLNLADGEETSGRSYLARAVNPAWNATIGEVKINAGRFVAAILRAAFSKYNSATKLTSSQSEIEDIFGLIIPETDLSQPLASMVTDWDAANSEGWFGMALLAKPMKGAELLVQTLKSPKVSEALEKLLVVGNDGQSVSSEKLHQRQNAVVMLTAIKGHGLDVEQVLPASCSSGQLAGLAVQLTEPANAKA